MPTAIYRKWLLRLAAAAGARTATCRTWRRFGGGGGGPGWGGLLSAITWRHYLYYGDRRVLEENYEAIRRYVDYLESHLQGRRPAQIRRAVGLHRRLGAAGPRHGHRELARPGGRRVVQQLLPDLPVAAAGADGRRPRQAGRRGALPAAAWPRSARSSMPRSTTPTKRQYVIDEQAYYVMPLHDRRRAGGRAGRSC